MKALGWNENAGTRADLVSCLEAMEDCFENDRVPRLMDKVAEVAQSREKTDKGARIEWLLQNPGEWKNDRWITDDDALLAYEEEGSECILENSRARKKMSKAAQRLCDEDLIEVLPTLLDDA